MKQPRVMPHRSTITRCVVRMDLAAMDMRRRWWLDAPPCSLTLAYNASPQHGVEISSHSCVLDIWSPRWKGRASALMQTPLSQTPRSGMACQFGKGFCRAKCWVAGACPCPTSWPRC